ncbi:MAG: PAS domain S-box protein [Cyclobacteriaceae bacterium]
MTIKRSPTQSVKADFKARDIVFRINSDDYCVVEIYGEHKLFKKSLVGSPFFELLGYSTLEGFKADLAMGNTPLVSYLSKDVVIDKRTFDLQVVETNSTECIAILQEITEQKKADGLLRDSEEKFRDVFNSIVDVYYKTDSQRRFTIMSPSIERISGLKPKDFIGKTTSQFIKKEKADQIYETLRTTGRVEDYRVNLKLPGGEFRTFSFNIEAVIDEDGQVCGTNGIIRNITTQALYEQELISSQEQFKNIFESISDIYYQSDVKGYLKMISPSVELITGYKVDEAIGMHESEFYVNPAIQKELLKVLKEKGYVKNGHGELLDKDGRVIYASLNASATYDKKGKFSGSHGIIRDISREQRQNNLTKLNKDILEKIATEADLKEILIFSCLGIEAIFPEIICSVLLYDEMNNWLVTGAGPSLPDGYNQAIDQFPVGANQCSCGTAAYTKELVVVSDIEKDPLWASASKLALDHNLKACWSVPILSSDLKVLGTFAVYYNHVRVPQKGELEIIKSIGNLLSIAIENNRNKLALVTSEKRYRQLINNSPVAILIYTDGMIKLVNEEAVHIAGAKSKTDLLEQPITKFIDQEVPVEKSKKGNQTTLIRSERNFRKLKNEIIPIEVIATDADYKGQPSIQLVFSDISERKEMEEQQNKLNEFLIKQNRQLEEFAHIASHNLRAPIANIYALMKLYEMDNSTENIHFVFDQLNNTSKNLYETINELTDVIQTSWELNKQKQRLKFSQTLEKVKQTVSGEIINKNAAINENFEQIDHVEYPKVYLESILQNLLSNALKYSNEERKPIIDITSKFENDNVILSFKDNGLGIDLTKHKDKVFGLRKTFHNNENARGVGLFITKAQIESMGGDIMVKSKVDEGCEFIINFGSVGVKQGSKK